jgi:hypothetical protein
MRKQMLALIFLFTRILTWIGATCLGLGVIIAMFGGGMGLISFAVSCFTGVLILFVLGVIWAQIFGSR